MSLSDDLRGGLLAPRLPYELGAGELRTITDSQVERTVADGRGALRKCAIQLQPNQAETSKLFSDPLLIDSVFCTGLGGEPKVNLTLLCTLDEAKAVRVDTHVLMDDHDLHNNPSATLRMINHPDFHTPLPQPVFSASIIRCRTRTSNS